jgi:hypothetical protein
LQPNETKRALDNYKPRLYLRSRDRFGEYSMPKIYFYEDVAEKVQGIEKEDFIKKCRLAKFDDFETEMAVKYFIENAKHECVWKWAIGKGMRYELDTMRIIKYRLKARLSKVLHSVTIIEKM